MKPESKRSTTTTTTRRDGGSSPFNIISLKHAIEAIDVVAKGNSIDLSSLSTALSTASREIKQTEKRNRRRENRKKRKKLVIGKNPETQAELGRWFSNFDKSLKLALPKYLLSKKCNHKVAPPKTLRDPQICQLNTDYTMNLCAESFRY